MNELFSLLPPQICYLLFGLRLPFWLNFLVLGLILFEPLEWLIRNRYCRWLIIFLPSMIILFQLLRNDFFFQSDDFAHLKIAAEYSFREIFVRGMGPQGVWGFHHLFTALWLFKAVFIFFGTNLNAYLLTNFFLHLISLGLFYLILNKVKKSPSFSILATSLFGTFYLSWISAMHELIATVFFLAGIFFWVNWLSKDKAWYLWSTLLFYLLAVCSKEVTSTLPIMLFLISVFWHFYVSKINFKKVAYILLPFFLIFVFHFLLYGKIYLGFFSLKEDAYQASFSLSIFIKNLLTYLTQIIPLIDFSGLRVLFFLFIIFIFDLWKRKMILIPLFLAYLMMITPPAFFENKITPYYTYIPSIFLYFLFFIFFLETYSFLKEKWKKKPAWLAKTLSLYFVLIIILGFFKLDKFLMDSCFLVQFPWKNPHRVALTSISQKLNNLFQEGKIEEGVIIKLDEEEITHEMEYLFTTNALYLFLEDERAINYQFVYDEENKALVVKAESSYHQMSF